MGSQGGLDLLIADPICRHLPGSSRHGFLGSQGPVAHAHYAWTFHRRALPKRVTEQSYRQAGTDGQRSPIELLATVRKLTAALTSRS